METWIGRSLPSILDLRVREVNPETSVPTKQETVAPLPAYVYFSSPSTIHPTHPFAPVAGQANLI